MFLDAEPDTAPLSTGPSPTDPEVPLKVVSWNLLRRVGAKVEDVAAVVRQHRPDLLLLQEATEDISRLPSLVGGHFFRHPMHSRIYGLAAWSASPFPAGAPLRLPVTVLPGGVPPRDALLVNFRGIAFANVHLSHGQFLNRWQLLHIADALEGPAAIVGDFNAVGPIPLPGFADIGPRQRTHRASNLIALRLDRCMARGLDCTASAVLDKGPSDHHPIVLTLERQAMVEPRRRRWLRRFQKIT
jgi:endonuclease/exonuclease/phosphatase family metal-dependent hydrolase